jgi:Fur family transcriptional regulator, ferric uptake regulator
MSTGEEDRRADAGRDARQPDTERLRRDLEAYMEREGLRTTDQRRAIIDVFFQGPEHVTIDEVLERVREHDAKVGYATVYRTMKMLAESGIAHERRFGDGFTRYELADDDAHHDHLICIGCGAIQEFEEPLIEELQSRIATRYEFDVHFHKHELYGLCAECQKAPRAKGHT